jgi:PIN domain nuclease of toxin-antitoxin system
VKLLLDSNIIIRAAQGNVPGEARDLIEDPDNEPNYSVAALWEITIKHGSGKLALPVAPWELELGLNAAGYRALDIKARHVNQLAHLPQILRDLFDRIMVAQAISEKMLLVTTDELLAGYGPAVKLV